MYISDRFIDKYLGLIPPVYITTYLYFVRRTGPHVPSAVCSDMSINATTLRKILRFWEEQKVISYVWKEVKDADDKLVVHIKPEKEELEEKSLKVSKQLLETPEFSEVMELVKTVFPSMKEQETLTKIAYLWKENGFRKDIFVVLLKYCRDHNAKYPAYMLTVAKKWADAGITTSDAALAWIDGKWSQFTLWKRSYGVSEVPNHYEITVFRDWDSKYDSENVLKAIEITVLKGKGLNLSYTSGILRNKYSSTAAPAEA